MLGSLNNWNIIHFSNKTTPSEDFDEVHQLVLDGISANISYIFQTGKYGTINEVDPKTLGHYMVKYLSEPHILQEKDPHMGREVRYVI